MPLRPTWIYDSYYRRNTWCVPMTPVVDMFAWLEAHAAEGFGISGVYGNFDHWNKLRAGDHTNRTTHDLWGVLPAVTGTDNVTRRFVGAIDYKLPAAWMARYETWCVAELRAKRAPWVKYMNINGHHYHRESNYAQSTSGDYHVHESFAPGYESKTITGLLLVRFYAEVMHPEGDDDMDGTTYIKGSAEVGVPGGTGDFSAINKPFSWWLSAMYAHILTSEQVVRTVAAGVARIDALDDESKASIDAAVSTLDEIRRRLEEEGQEPPPSPELVLGPPLYGLDANAWRGDIDWPTAAAWRNGDHRMAFATLKASHGAANQVPPDVDAHWAREAPEMAASGIPLVGGFHRLTLDAPAGDQVSKFLAALAQIGGPAGRLVQLDCEAGAPDAIRAWMAEWNARTDSYPVMGYLPDWKEGQWTASELGSYGFAGWWASEYVTGQGDPVGLATLLNDEHWHSHDGIPPTILQYSDSAVVPGVSGGCDVNLFRGTLAELRELATRPGDG